jgi:hypothetical protein
MTNKIWTAPDFLVHVQGGAMFCYQAKQARRGRGNFRVTTRKLSVTTKIKIWRLEFSWVTTKENCRRNSCWVHMIQKQHVMLFLFTCARRRPTGQAGVAKNFSRNLFVTTRFKSGLLQIFSYMCRPERVPSQQTWSRAADTRKFCDLSRQQGGQ